MLAGNDLVDIKKVEKLAALRVRELLLPEDIDKMVAFS